MKVEDCNASKNNLNKLNLYRSLEKENLSNDKFMILVSRIKSIE